MRFRGTNSLIAVGLFLAFSPARAEDARSVSESSPPEAIQVWEFPNLLTFSPGVFTFEENSAGNPTSTRLMVSVLFDWNFSPMGPVETPVQYGLQSGLQYSHLGGPGSNFFGTGSRTGADGNLFVIPLNFWAGYHWERARLLFGIHTGASLYLVSDEDSIALGRTNDGSGGAAEFYPNLGFRISWDTGKNVAVSFRNDWTLAPNFANYAGMLGATLPLS